MNYVHGSFTNNNNFAQISQKMSSPYTTWNQKDFSGFFFIFLMQAQIYIRLCDSLSNSSGIFFFVIPPINRQLASGKDLIAVLKDINSHNFITSADISKTRRGLFQEKSETRLNSVPSITITGYIYQYL